MIADDFKAIKAARDKLQGKTLPRASGEITSEAKALKKVWWTMPIYAPQTTPQASPSPAPSPGDDVPL